MSTSRFDRTSRLRIVDSEPPQREVNAFVRIAAALERIADRFDADAKEFDKLVQRGKGLG